MSTALSDQPFLLEPSFLSSPTSPGSDFFESLLSSPAQSPLSSSSLDDLEENNSHVTMIPENHVAMTTGNHVTMDLTGHQEEFEQLLENLHQSGNDQFGFFPMETDSLEGQEYHHGNVSGGGGSGDEEDWLSSSDLSSSVDDAASVPFELPSFSSTFTSISTAVSTAASASSSASTTPTTPVQVTKRSGRKIKPTPLALLSASHIVKKPVVTAASPPPSSPPSSPSSESDSRSLSPFASSSSKGANNGNAVFHDDLLSSKPTVVQIGKNVSIEISERDLVNFEIEEIARIAGTKFTKGEEKELKRLRRKSRNKVSAAQSRDKKKDYLSGLEERVDTVNSLNFDLKKRLKELERENSLLKGHVSFLSSHVEPSVRASIPAATIVPPNDIDDEAGDMASVSSGKSKAGRKNPSFSSSSSSLLTAAHGVPARGKGAASTTKSTGVYLMLVFVSFGIFFSAATQNGPLSISLPTPGAAPSKMDASAPTLQAPSTMRPFVFRKIHAYDESPMIDTIPMLDHLDQPNTTCDDESFWDAYYEADLSGVDFNERYKHEMVMWKDCPNTAFHSSPLGTTEIAGLDEKLSKIKAQLENHEAVDSVVCSSTMCLVRLEQGDVF